MSALFDREGLGLLAVAATVVVLLVVGAWFLYHPPASTPPTANSGSKEPPQLVTSIPDRSGKPSEISYPGQDGATVLDLLKAEHQVRLDSELMLFGSIVLQIDSQTARPDEFWAFYRDSLRGDKSPERCTTHTGETIHWVLRQRR